MSEADIVKKIISDAENGRADEIFNYLTNDFTFSGMTPVSLGKDRFVAFLNSLHQAFSDLSFNLSEVKQEENLVRARIRITGKHSGIFQVPGITAVPPIPATGMDINLPEEPVNFLFRSGNIYKIVVEAVPGGGIESIINQIRTGIPELLGKFGVHI